jgi:hypothetical protein
MSQPHNIVEADIPEPAYLDLKRLSIYSSLGVPTLRNYLKSGLPHYKLQGKILVKVEHFNLWMRQFFMNKKQDLDAICDDVLKSLKS